MTAHVDEIHRMVAEDPRFAGEPDLGAIRRRGRRLRTRRRIATGVATVAVVAGVALPVAALTTGAPGSPDTVGPATSVSPTTGPTAPTTSPATSTPTTTGESWILAPVADLPTELPDGCGSFACLDDSTPETGEVVGEPWSIAGFFTVESGLPVVDEVVYAVRESPGARPVVALGLLEGDEVRRVAVLFRPGRDFRDTPLRVAGAAPRQGQDGSTYAMFGMVEDEPVSSVASWTGAGPWDGAPLNDDLIPGYGVFWVAGRWDPAWPVGGPAQVTLRVDGQEYAPPAP